MLWDAPGLSRLAGLGCLSAIFSAIAMLRTQKRASVSPISQGRTGSNAPTATSLVISRQR
jgi:hypothetical protein